MIQPRVRRARYPAPESVTNGARSGGSVLETRCGSRVRREAWQPGATLYLVNSGDVDTSLAYAVQNGLMESPFPSSAKAMVVVRRSKYLTIRSRKKRPWHRPTCSRTTIILAAGDNGAADCDERTGEPPGNVGKSTLGWRSISGKQRLCDRRGRQRIQGDGTAAAPETGSGTYWNDAGREVCRTDLVTSR